MNKSLLLNRIREITTKKFQGRKILRFEESRLDFLTHCLLRDKPKDYLELTATILTLLNGKIIVELGSMRQKMLHPVDVVKPLCCNDGHSTFMWCFFTSCEIYTVDLNPYCKTIIEENCKKYLDRVHSNTCDAIDFLKRFDKKVDLLYLDAWDVDSDPHYAENHLKAYVTIKHNLNNVHLILIDDTDIDGLGKGKVLIPELIQEGYHKLIEGRQTLLINRSLF